MANNTGVQKAGDVIIEQLSLVTSTNTVIDIREFLVELNLYEDMFANYLKGTIVLSDSRNLIEKGPIIGEEFLTLTVRTPSYEDTIKKSFKIFSLSDRKIVRDNNTQIFTLHFVSVEVYYDVLLPLYVPLQGNIGEVAGRVFSDFIAATRDYDITENSTQTSVREANNETPMVLLNETSNDIKMVVPGWTPFKTINWLASKAIPKHETAKNYLFFESNKSFYFGSIEYLLKDVALNNNYIGEYTISASNIRDGQPTPDLNREYFIAREVDMVTTVDTINNFTNGYLSSRLITLDVFNKKYEAIDYNYTEEYSKQWHTSGSGKSSIPVFNKETVSSPFTHISFYPVNPKLFQNTKDDYFKDNVSERMGEIYGNRRSSMLDLTNLRLHMTVHGRTDVEVGNVMRFKYPGLGGKDSSSKEDDSIDKNYSGYYLITAIHHKISKLNHSMTMECVKDSLYVDPTSTFTYE